MVPVVCMCACCVVVCYPTTLSVYLSQMKSTTDNRQVRCDSVRHTHTHSAHARTHAAEDEPALLRNTTQHNATQRNTTQRNAPQPTTHHNTPQRTTKQTERNTATQRTTTHRRTTERKATQRTTHPSIYDKMTSSSVSSFACFDAHVLPFGCQRATTHATNEERGNRKRREEERCTH